MKGEGITCPSKPPTSLKFKRCEHNMWRDLWPSRCVRAPFSTSSLASVQHKGNALSNRNPVASRLYLGKHYEQRASLERWAVGTWKLDSKQCVLKVVNAVRKR